MDLDKLNLIFTAAPAAFKIMLTSKVVKSGQKELKLIF